MNRFKNILAVWTDSLGSDDVVEQATALSLANDARLTLAADCGRRGALPWQRELNKRLRRIASAVESSTQREIETRVISGTPSETVVREVADNDYDLVIMSSDTGETLGGSLLGGTKRRLMKHCPCPVWFVNPGQQVPYKRVLAVVDPCLNDGDDRALNMKITEIAASLTTDHGAELHLVNAWEVDGPDQGKVRSELWPEDRETLINKHLTRRRRAIDEFLRPVKGSGLSYEIHLPRTLSSLAIHELVTGFEIDVIVMKADEGYSLPFLPGGTMAETLLDSFPCSVLSIARDGSSDRISAERSKASKVRGGVAA